MLIVSICMGKPISVITSCMQMVKARVACVSWVNGAAFIIVQNNLNIQFAHNLHCSTLQTWIKYIIR